MHIIQLRINRFQRSRNLTVAAENRNQLIMNTLQDVALSFQVGNHFRDFLIELIITVSIGRRTGQHQNFPVIGVQLGNNSGNTVDNISHIAGNRIDPDSVFPLFKMEQQRLSVIIRKRDHLPVGRIRNLYIGSFLKLNFTVNGYFTADKTAVKDVLPRTHHDFIKAFGINIDLIFHPLAGDRPSRVAGRITAHRVEFNRIQTRGLCRRRSAVIRRK